MDVLALGPDELREPGPRDDALLHPAGEAAGINRCR